MRDSILSCTACRLSETRTQVVAGSGDHGAARIALIGEAPGEREDIEGVPFVGKAGRLLRERILPVVPLSEEEVWIDNLVSCRPPGNRIRDYPDAIVACSSLWLEEKIGGIPVIVALGATSGSYWFPGRSAHEMAALARAMPSGQVVVGSLHPSYALRSGKGKEVVGSIVRSLRRAKELVGHETT